MHIFSAFFIFWMVFLQSDTRIDTANGRYSLLPLLHKDKVCSPGYALFFFKSKNGHF